MSLAGKVALITGGLGGLGREFARALLCEKVSTVCLIDIVQNGDSVVSQIAKEYSHATVNYVRCDVTDYDSFQDVVVGTKKKYGHLDILCNNAGILALGHDVERSKLCFRLNLEAVYFGTKLGLEHMNENDGGRGGVIVNVASMAAFWLVKQGMAYASTKAGVVALTRTASLEYADTGVRVNTICPSFTDTPILDQSPGLRESLKVHPYHSILTPEFVAEGFRQLVVDESKNGAIMTVTPDNGIDYYEYPRRKQASKL